MNWEPKQEACCEYLTRKVREARPGLKLKIKRHERIRSDTIRLWYGGVEVAGVDDYIYGGKGFFRRKKKLLKIITNFACRVDTFNRDTKNIIIYDKSLTTIIKDALEGTPWVISNSSQDSKNPKP